MAAIREILAYFLKHYPHAGEMSNARVTKMVYLCDWRHAIETGQQVSPIQWIFDSYGPFVWDVKKTAEDEPAIFNVDRSLNYYGTPKLILSLRDKEYSPVLTQTEQAAANHVIAATKNLGWDAFIKLVYSTYPIIKCDRYSSLDLPSLAHEYNQYVRHSPAAVIG
jgi:hypothetical protein